MKIKRIRNLIVIIFFFVLLLSVSWNAVSFWEAVEWEQENKVRYWANAILNTLLLLNCAFLFKQIVNLVYYKKYNSSGQISTAPKLFKDLLIALIFFVDLLLIIRLVFDQPITGIWLTSGALALILGFALRNIILDLFSGIAVNIEKPYKIGDWIEIHQRFAMESIIGQVTDISWRATHIRTEVNTNVVIPNSMMTTMVVTTNYWHQSKPTRFEVTITLDFSIASHRAKRILLAGTMDAQRTNGFVKEKTPQVLIDHTDEIGVVYEVRYWITPWQGISPSIARDTVYSAILKHMDAAGVKLAYPKEDVYYNDMPTRQLDPDKITDRSKLISKIEIFSVLTDEEAEQLSKSMSKHVFNAGQTVVKQGEGGSSMFVLLEGLLDVSIKEAETIVTVATLAPCDYFGEMCLLTGENRSATITTLSESVVYEIKQNDFMELLYKRDEIAELIAFEVGKRRQSNTQLLDEEKKLNKNQIAEDYSYSLIYKIRKFFSAPRDHEGKTRSPNHLSESQNK